MTEIIVCLQHGTHQGWNFQQGHRSHVQSCPVPLPPSSALNFYVDLSPKRYLGPRDPIIGSMGYGWGLN